MFNDTRETGNSSSGALSNEYNRSCSCCARTPAKNAGVRSLRSSGQVQISRTPGCTSASDMPVCHRTVPAADDFVQDVGSPDEGITITTR